MFLKASFQRKCSEKTDSNKSKQTEEKKEEREKASISYNLLCLESKLQDCRYAEVVQLYAFVPLHM